MLRACLTQNSTGNRHMTDKMPFVKQEAAELCRICETMENLLDISTEEFSHLNEKLHRIADFEDDYSCWLKFICISCGTKLENAFDFKIQCEDTYRKLVDQIEGNTFTDQSYLNSNNESYQQSNRHDLSGNAEAPKDKSFFDIYEVIELGNRNENTNMAQNNFSRPKPKYQYNGPKAVRNFSNNATSGEQFVKIVDVESGEKQKSSYVCAMCNDTFKEKWKMREHIHWVHMSRRRSIFGNCDKVNIDTTMYRHPTATNDKKIPCDVCGRLFRTKAYLELHKKNQCSASKVRRLPMFHANTSNSYSSMLDTFGEGHFSGSRHGSRSLYTCELCDKSFQRRQGLRVHYQIHTDERPYPCTYCDKAFRCRSHLNRHIYTHTGEKKYKCQVCQKAFTQSGSLRIHMRIHTGELPYQCPHCFVRFRVRKTLLNHRKRCFPIKQERYK